MAACLHCEIRKSVRPRGLCMKCYYTPGIREQYPAKKVSPHDHEPTEAELDALIEQQLANAPRWFHEEPDKLGPGRRGPARVLINTVRTSRLGGRRLPIPTDS